MYLQHTLGPLYNCCSGYQNVSLRFLSSGIIRAYKIATFEDVKAIKDNKKCLLIDVRNPSELQETGTLPGSINIPLEEVKEVLKDLSANKFVEQYCCSKPELDFPIIFSCRSGRRSAIALEIAAQLGYTNLKNYLGGWIDWEERAKE